MLINLMMGLAVMVVCLFVQALLVVYCIHYYSKRDEVVDSPTLGSSLALISTMMLFLVIGNFIQICIWAALFMHLGEFADMNTAAYHSAVNFATLGYGDIVMSEDHRILGPMQAVNGVLMVGVTTSVMMSAAQNMLKRTYDARRQES